MPQNVIPDRSGIRCARHVQICTCSAGLPERHGILVVVGAQFDDLAKRVAERCRLSGEFTLRSGQTANTYFDKYLFEGDPEILRDVAELMVPLVPAGHGGARGPRAWRRSGSNGAIACHGVARCVRAEGCKAVRNSEACRGHGNRGPTCPRRRGRHHHRRAGRGVYGRSPSPRCGR